MYSAGNPRRPSLATMAVEAAAFLRSLAERGFAPPGAEIPRGDGHAVLILPSVGRGDGQTAPVRAFLAAIGYAPFGWELGINFGPTAKLLAGAMDRLTALAAAHGPVSLVGYSMGGLFARWLALRAPQCVRQAITVCSPFRDPAGSAAFPLEPLLGFWPGVDLRSLAKDVGRPLSVPGTFLYSRADGIIAWNHCIDGNAAPGDNIEVTGPHTTMPKNPEVMRILAERLARKPPA
jgi:pimeloyl-ACP methyl ester carboxylesterase